MPPFLVFFRRFFAFLSSHFSFHYIDISPFRILLLSPSFITVFFEITPELIELIFYAFISCRHIACRRRQLSLRH